MKYKILRIIINFFNIIRNPVSHRVMLLLTGLTATVWFLIRVIPKPQRATYPCMRASAPLMSAFVIWLTAFLGTTFSLVKIKQKLRQSKYLVAGLFIVTGISSAAVLAHQSSKKANSANTNLEIWYKPNNPLGEARGIFPGRVAWGHNPKIASWDGKTGFWWEDRFNNQKETDKLLTQTLLGLTNAKTEKLAWNDLFLYFNKTKHSKDAGYQRGEKIAVKINDNNTYSHESNEEINANPQLVLSLLRSLVKVAKIPEENITIAEPSRFITDNIFDKCHAEFPNVHYVDHNGGEGREAATFVENAIPYSVNNGKTATGLASCFVNADYVISMALMKGHVSQGVTLSAKNFFGCTSIETDWRKNHHSGGFSQNKDGSHKYLVFTDFLGHKDLGGKTMLFLIDGIYGNKFVDKVPGYKWSLAPFNGNWPNSLFASQDGVAVDAVVLDFIIKEWPDAPDMMYSDYYLRESALAGNPPSGTKYDPERDGTPLNSLGVMEHWNNPQDKQYTRNLKTGDGIELVYKKVK